MAKSVDTDQVQSDLGLHNLPMLLLLETLAYKLFGHLSYLVDYKA